MYKLVTLVKRKAGTSKEQFKDYYETHHSKLGEKYLPPYCKKYLRRYLQPVAHPMKAGQLAGPDFDCLVELWFDTAADCKAFEASVSAPELVKMIVEDEEQFLDRTQTFRYLVDDHLSFGPA
jgi:EthD domain